MSDIGAIQRAARSGDLDTVRRLLGNGTDIHHGANECGTALHWAVAWGRDAIVEFLLDSGADPSLTDDEGLTPLHLAAKKGYTDTNVLERLLSVAGAVVNAQSEVGMTALHNAAQRGRLDFVELLLDSGADPCMTNASGETPLDLALKKGHVAVVERLKDHGAR